MNQLKHATSAAVPGESDRRSDQQQQSEQLRGRLNRLAWQLAEKQKQLKTVQQQSGRLQHYVDLAPEVSEALKALSSELFEQDLRLLEEKLTIALNEVLKQPIRFRATPGFKGNVATVEFSIQRNGHQEDIRRGQGGSVHNVLSVGLRMFALTTLDPGNHRPVLVLDEQDCWLRPDLVPHLVNIVHQAGKELGYQVILISHHDLDLFEQYADRIYRLVPDGDTVKTELVAAPCHQSDYET